MLINWENEKQRSFGELSRTGRLYELSIVIENMTELYHLLGGKCKAPPGSFRDLMKKSEQIYRDKMDGNIMPEELPTGEIVTPERKAEAYKNQNIRLRGEIERLKLFYSQFQDLLVSTLSPMPAIKFPKRMQKGKVDHAIIQTIADIHGGEWVKKEETGTLSEYNYDIFLRRRDTFLDGFTNQLTDFRRSYKVNTLYILGLGDWVTGEDVFHMQLARVDLSIGEQILLVAQEMARTILAMSEHFAHTEVLLQFGNHGKERNTTNNNDITVYMMVKMLLSQQENINIHISPSNFIAFTIGPDSKYVDFGEFKRPYNYTVFHGQEANRYMGVPYYGITRAKSRFDQMVNQVSDFMFVGHHHVDAQMWDDHWGVTASWVGGTEYSIGKLQACSRPSQHFYTFSPKYGLGWNIQSYLDDEPTLAELNEAGIRGNEVNIPTLE